MSRIQKHANVSVADMADLFSWLDDDMSDSVNMREFVKGFRHLNEELSTKALSRTEYHVKKFVHNLGTSFTKELVGINHGMICSALAGP